MRIEFSSERLPDGVRAAIKFTAENEQERQVLTEFTLDSKRHPAFTFMIFEREGPLVTEASGYLNSGKILTQDQFEQSYERIRAKIFAEGWQEQE